MKVIVIHNDLRVYWKRRLVFLHYSLKAKGIDLYAVELFGKGSPYDFESFKKIASWWDCLFPDQSHTELTKKEIKDKIFDKLNEIDADVIIGGSIVFYSGALGLRWAKQHNKKFIMFDDGKPSWIKRNFIIQGIKDIITKQIDALWLPSEEYDNEYSALYSKKNIKYLYGYDCVDNDLFKGQGVKKMDNKKFITISRLVPKKNVKSLLDAWKFVEKNYEDYTLDILGDGPLAEELKTYKDELGLKHVNFIGAIPNERLPEFLTSADAFISPSLYESWGLVVNEAMAAGLPVLLSTKINAAHTLLKDGENGYLFDPYQPNVLQDKIIQFINLSLAEKKKMSLNSLRIISKMDFDYMESELLQTLNFFKTKPKKRPSIIGRLVMNAWYGRYNTTEWDTIDPRSAA